ncbi:MAG: hypothetical protein WBX15_20745 [Thermoanaerobaculia bacterium]
MKKIAMFLLLAVMTAATSFASYIVILKDGTRYRATQKWTLSGGKALVKLEDGSVLQLDPKLIDVKKSEAMNQLGLGDVNVIAQEAPPAAEAPASRPVGLGSIARIRKLPGATNEAPDSSTAGPASSNSTPVQGSGPGYLGNDVTSKFVSAFENVGLFGAKITASAPYKLRIEIPADNEDQVFKAISATSYMMLRIPEATGQRIDMVELFMATISGGAAGRFQMSREDAQNIDVKKISLPDYFLQKVLF